MTSKTVLACLGFSMLWVAPTFCAPQKAIVGKGHMPLVSTSATQAKSSDIIDTHPDIGADSTRGQIERFVAFFAARGFHETRMTALYYPSGKIKRFHYHSDRGNTKVTASIEAATPKDKAGKTTSSSEISIYEEGSTKTTYTPSITTTTIIGPTSSTSGGVKN